MMVGAGMALFFYCCRNKLPGFVRFVIALILVLAGIAYFITAPMEDSSSFSHSYRSTFIYAVPILTLLVCIIVAAQIVRKFYEFCAYCPFFCVHFFLNCGKRVASLDICKNQNPNTHANVCKKKINSNFVCQFECFVKNKNITKMNTNKHTRTQMAQNCGSLCCFISFCGNGTCILCWR